MLLQEIWRTDIGWDDNLPGPQLSFWTKWKDLLPQATTIQVPRHYSPLLRMAYFIELHTFVDAREYVYAAVCYFGIGKGDDITVSQQKVKWLPTSHFPYPAWNYLLL